MIKTKQDLHLYLQNDAKANRITSVSQYLIRLLFEADNACALRYLRALRHQEYHLNNSNFLLHRIPYYWYKYRTTCLSRKYNICIMVNSVGYGIYLPHLQGGVIITCKSMGYGCTVNSGVVVGQKYEPNGVAEAIIGNNVTLAVGSKVIGGVTIGDNAFIAPNAVVVKDVPAKAVVGGIPAKILKMNE